MASVVRRYRRDLLLAGAVTLVTVLLSAVIGSRPQHLAATRSLDVWGVALLVVGGAALAARRRYPTSVLLVVYACVLTYDRLSYPRGAAYLPLIIAFFTAMTRGDRRVAYGVLALGYLLSALPSWRTASPAEQLGLLGWFLVLAAAAEITRVWSRARRAERERSLQAQRARLEQERRRAGEERLRIAQDLHDVLAHQLALITVQANAGLAMLLRAPDRTEASLKAIKSAGNTALAELHGVLDVLRTPQTGAPTRPTPMLSSDADMAALFDGARAAGLTVHARVDGVPRSLPGLVDQVGYRILQEALTNAVRHAGAGTTATVCVDYGSDALRLSVDDDGAGTPSGTPTPSGGNGLAGMRERVATVHGTLTAGRKPGQGFRVEAVLPT
jgi:signal transduction histidine kinase